MSLVDEHEELGLRLREYRRHRQLTLAEVAQQAGISSGHLSMLERGRSSASISVLRKLAQALGISISHLFEAESPLGPVPLKKADRPRLDSEPGAGKFMLSRPPLKAFEVYAGEFEPGASTGDEDYVHGDSQELLIVHSGEIEILLSGVTHRLSEGDSIEFRSSMPHKITNVSPGMSYVTWVISPPSE